MFSCQILEIFKSTFFAEHFLQVSISTASSVKKYNNNACKEAKLKHHL